MLSDNVEFYLNSFRIENIKSFSIRNDLFQGAGNFTASIDPLLIIPLAAAPISFEWRINGEIVMRGFLDKCTKSYSKDSHSLEVSGRDLCSVLIDNSIIKPTTYTSDAAYVTWIRQATTEENEIIKYKPKWTVVDLIDDIWKNNNSISSIKEALDTDKDAAKITAGKYYKETKVSPPRSLWPLDFFYTEAAKKITDTIPQKMIKTAYGQSLFDAFTSILSPLGLIIYHDPITNQIIIHSINNSNTYPVSYTATGDVDYSKTYHINNISEQFLQGIWMGEIGDPTNEIRPFNNIMSCEFEEDISNFFPYIKIIGQTETAMDWSGETQKNFQVLERITPSYNGLFKIKATEVNSIDSAAWNKTKNQIVDNQFLQQNRKMYGLKYKMHGLLGTDNRPWQLNHRCEIYDSYIPMVNVIFMVYAREFSGSKEQGYTTNLTMGLPNLSAPYIEQYFNKVVAGQTKLSDNNIF